MEIGHFRLDSAQKRDDGKISSTKATAGYRNVHREICVVE